LRGVLRLALGGALARQRIAEEHGAGAGLDVFLAAEDAAGQCLKLRLQFWIGLQQRLEFQVHGFQWG
jgi:hypothetical protein